MEEIDNIIIHSLRQIGCSIHEDVKSIQQFSTDLLIEATVRCLEIIRPGLGLPLALPSNLSARFRVASSIAQACQDTGFTGDVGFQTFLYSSESDIRKIFMFLIEKLPKEPEKVIIDAPGSSAFFRKAIGDKVKSQLAAAWVPNYCLSSGLRWLDDGSYSQEGCGHYQPFLPQEFSTENSRQQLSDAWREYYVKHLPTVSHSISSQRKLLPTLITLNSTSLLTPTHIESSKSNTWVSESVSKSLDLCSDVKYDNNLDSLPEHHQLKSNILNSHILSRTSDQNRKPKIAPKPKGLEIDSVVEKRRSEDDEIFKIKEEMDSLRQRYDGLQICVKTLSAKLIQLSEETLVEEQLLKDGQESCEIKRRTCDLLPEADINAVKLQEMVEISAQKLVNLALQWEKHRSPLLEQYRIAKQRNSNKASESQRQLEAVRNLREKSKELSEELRNKEQSNAQLLADYEKIPKDINRSAYTRRILEIIGNISKQKKEIDKVLSDTKDLQKEINNLSGQLDRSFTVADEMIFKDAKKDEASRRAYKLLATLHSDCNELVHMIEDTGATVREIRDLEEQIDMESVKNVGANLDRISADLKQMKQESAVLSAQLKSKS